MPREVTFHDDHSNKTKTTRQYPSGCTCNRTWNNLRTVQAEKLKELSDVKRKVNFRSSQVLFKSCVQSCISEITWTCWPAGEASIKGTTAFENTTLYSQSTCSHLHTIQHGPCGTPLTPTLPWQNCLLSTDKQVKAVCKSAFFHLSNIAKLGKYISFTHCKILIHAFITSKLDYRNSLLSGLQQDHINKLQLVQKSAARLLIHKKKNKM